MCLYPKLIMNRKYMINKKNGGNIPECKDERTKWIPVGCGKCIECLKQKKRAWQIRMSEEIKVNKNGKFVTLTFSEESLIKLESLIDTKDIYLKYNEVARIAVRRFLERWRKKYKKSVRHWLVTELGHTGTERIHLHGILFTDMSNKEITDIWQYGFIWFGQYVNEKTINYIIKYINKQDKDHPNYIPRILTSAGIGSNYIKSENAKLNMFKENETREYYTTRTGHRINLPIYYRNNLYSEEERETLWTEKLDKQKRYVCGEEIDISDNEIQYEKIREFYRHKNKRLGYGDDILKWDEKQYKNNQKRLKLKNKLLKEAKKETNSKINN